MKLERHGVVLRPRADIGWEAAGVFNASVVFDQSSGLFHMLYRGLQPGFTRLKVNGMDVYTDGFVSAIGHATSRDGITWDADREPWLSPDQNWCAHGVEDPRISRFGGKWYVHYVAVEEEPYLSFINPEHPKAHEYVHIATASTRDFVSVVNYGVTGPPQNSKAAALFPRPIKGKIGLIATVEIGLHRSSIIYVAFDDISEVEWYNRRSWENAVPILNGTIGETKPGGGPNGFEIGSGPIETEDGWLLIIGEITDGIRWDIGAALLDLDDPNRVTHRLPCPLLTPETPDERHGRVNNVCFPEAALVVGDELRVYYGAGDQVVCLAKCGFAELKHELLRHPITPTKPF